MKRKILVCGSTGFIGRNIAQALSAKEEFEVAGTYLKSRPLDNPRIRMIRADLTDKKDVARVMEGKDIVVLAAATTSGAKDIVSKPYYHVTDTAVMNSLLLRAAHDCGVKHVVFLSCTVMYRSSDRPVKESDFDANAEIYPSYFGGAWMKIFSEKMCEFYSRIGDMKCTVIRHSNIYGSHDKFDLERSHVFGATMTKVMMAKDGGKVVVWGRGEEARDLLYVSDLVDFVLLALAKQQGKFEIYNVGLGSAISVAGLVAKIIAASGKRIAIEYDVSKPNIQTRLCLDTTKAQRQLGWRAKVSLDEGIWRTMKWYAENIQTEKVGVCIKD